LPPDAHRTINALRRAADIVVQKSLREGFGLTVTEALWKGKPVIGGDVGGIRLQAIDRQAGFSTSAPKGGAYPLFAASCRTRCGKWGKTPGIRARQFLITRHLREYPTSIVALTHAAEKRIERA